MKRVDASSWYANIWVGGSHADAVRLCRQFCMVGLCVTVTPTTYVYTAGAEEGVCVRLINYPRFPASTEALQAKAKELAEFLCTELCQWSYSIEMPENTIWVSRRPEDNQ